MPFWSKDTLLEAIGFGPETSSPPPTMDRKRRTSEDVGRLSKARRHKDEAHRSTPYGIYYSPREIRASVNPTAEDTQQLPRRVSTSETHTRVDEDEGCDSVLSFDIQLSADFVSNDEDEDALDSSPPKHDSVHQIPSTLRPQTRNIRMPKAVSRKHIAIGPVPKLAAQTPVAQKPTSPKKKPATKKDTEVDSPNQLAHALALRSRGSVKPIQREFHEPEYAFRDAEIRGGMWSIQDMLEDFSNLLFAFTASRDALTPQFSARFSPETAKVIGCVASGGPGGVRGWHTIFLNVQPRRALVMAIVGNVLVEQVFQHMFFGGIAKHVREVTELQEKYQKEDGKSCFDRNARYATHIRSVLDTEGTGSFRLPGNFSAHVNYIVGVIYTHLAPILALDSPSLTHPSIMIPRLYEIVTRAGLLAVSMRMDPHTVYYIEPVFKEDTFSSERMECFNQHQMEQTNPRTPETHDLLHTEEKRRRAGLSAAEKKRSKNDDALTQIIIMDGVTAYRRGGWESADSKVLDVKYEKSEFGNQGIRSRVLTAGWVYCRWGRARQFKDGKSADIPAAHGTAWNEGFREFSEVVGVVDWVGVERKEKEHNKKVMLAALKAKQRASTGRRSQGDVTLPTKDRSIIQEMGLQEQLRAESSE